MEDEPNMLTMRELRPRDADDGRSLTVSDGDEITHYRGVAAHSRTRRRSSRCSGSTRSGKLIKPDRRHAPDPRPPRPVPDPCPTPDPLTRSRRGISERDLAATVTLERDPDDELDHVIDDNEPRLEDTIRVNPNEIVGIAVRFNTYRRPVHGPLPHPRARKTGT